MELDLNESAQVVLGAGGNGSVAIGPLYSAQTWRPTMISIKVSSNASEPTFNYYWGKTAGLANQLGGTFVGSNNQDTLDGRVLHPGDSWLCVWTGGDVGATASVTLTGKMEVPD